MKILKYIIFILCCAFTTLSFSQKKDKLQVVFAGKGFTEKGSESGTTTFLRDNQQQVHFVHNGVNLYCDKAVLYKKENFVEAFSNVRMVQGDTITMTAKYI